MSWQDLAVDRHHEQLTADESWEALRQAWVAAYAAAADLVATRVDPALVASASGEQWITADEWSGIVDQAGVYDAVNDIVNDGLVASAVDLGVPLDDRTLMSTVTEFVRSITDAVDYLRATIDAFHESALRRQWTADEFGRALRTSGASPLSAARATRFATGQASGALNAGIHAGVTACPRRTGIETFAVTANSCSDIAAVRWVTQRDERVRPAHAAADTDTVPLGETFTIDGHPARFPGDPNLPIGLRINCRCYLAWVDGTGVRRILGATKADLYATAQRLDIDGRSRMSKAELQSALLNELCLQGLAGGPDCPDVFDQMNRTTLMTYARQENVVGRWRMTRRELVEQLRATMRGGDRIRVAAGFAPAGEFSTAQRRATRKRARAAALEVGDDQVPPYRLRRAARRDVFAEFGGDRRGYVPCAFCGLKVNPDPTSGLAVLVPTPIRPFADGGTAALANILPGCPSCFRAHAASRAAAALVAAAGRPGEQFDDDDVEMPDWVRRRSEARLRRFLADAEFHLRGTEHDHDQQTHGGGGVGRTLAQMSPEERLEAAAAPYREFRYEYQGEEFRAVADPPPWGSIDTPDDLPVEASLTAAKRISVAGRIMNQDGEVVGEFHRDIFPWEDPPTVYNDTLSIDEEYQNRGIGSAFLDQTEAGLARVGIEQAEVTAVAVGKYAWAARGYRLSTDSGEAYVWRRIRSWADEVDRIRPNLTAEEAAAADAVLAAWTANPNDVIPADLVVVSPRKMVTVFRKGLDWDGVRDIRPRRREPAMAASAPLPTDYTIRRFHLQGQHNRQPIPDQEDTDEPDPPRRTPSESPGARSRRHPRRRVDPG